ncbi:MULTISPECIES: hypothetical protein [Sporomusa]
MIAFATLVVLMIKQK